MAENGTEILKSADTTDKRSRATSFREDTKADDSDKRGRSTSFLENDAYVRTKSGTFIRRDSDSNSRKESMPEFRNALQSRLQKTKESMPQGLMREVLETYKPNLLTRRWRLIEDFVRDLNLNNDHIHVVEQQMREAIKLGLQGKEGASVKCFPTYVKELPNGSEHGKFLSLDLGGTNFRVIFMELTKNKEFMMDSKIFAIPANIMIGHGDILFDHIANCLANFVRDRQLQEETLPLGFTFSFPLAQEGLAKANLVRWTKGFNCEGVEGNDVVALLKQALDRRGDVKIDVCAILNDTTGCLMSCAWKDDRCRIGLILGTGTNACYLEDVRNIGTLDQKDFSGQEHMVINTEWGAFGDNGELNFIKTRWDERVDEMSVNPGKQIFEKMISGMYMGELVRQVLVDLMKDDLIFVGCDREGLLSRGSFFTRYASEIESDPVGEYTRARQALEELGMDPDEVSDDDCSALRYVCEAVSRRASMMASAGITALLKKMDYKDVVIAIDGSLFRFHPHFKNVMQSRISQMMGINYKFDLLLSEDGSGRGAALVAAVLNRGKSGKDTFTG